MKRNIIPALQPLLIEDFNNMDFTIYYIGQEFKYQIESTIKLFYPAQTFKHEFLEKKPSEPIEGNYILTGIKQDKIIAEIKAGEKFLDKSQIAEKSWDEKNLCMSICRLVFKLLEEFTEKTPSWGILTGVRPVKQLGTILKQVDYNKTKADEILKNNYFCTAEKRELAFKVHDVQENILKTLDKNKFSLYVSIPFCPTRCAYCSFASQQIQHKGTNANLINEYVDNLCKEIEYTGKLIADTDKKIDTVYFGGGTPTSITWQQLEKIMQTVAKSFDLSKMREYTVEAGRPDTVTKEKLDVIKQYGAKRISINPQTLNQQVLDAIGRKHTVEDFFNAFSLARQVGFDSINCDIIAGLTGDTNQSFFNTIDGILKLDPENITVHTLSIKRASNLNAEKNSAQQAVKTHTADMIDYSQKRLLENNYLPYYLYRQKNMLDNLENVGWCKKGFESLYNIFIMEEIQTIIAMGAGASSKIVKDGNIERIFNYKIPLEYNKHFDEVLNRKNQILQLL